jgi:hypothetical protein
MNEQIQNLKDKIWTEEYWTNPNTDKLLPAQLNRFAELILIEVTDILSTYRGKVVFEDGAEYNYEHPIIAIRKHFGVKE